jgi:hypothetical protein
MKKIDGGREERGMERRGKRGWLEFKQQYVGADYRQLVEGPELFMYKLNVLDMVELILLEGGVPLVTMWDKKVSLST